MPGNGESSDFEPKESNRKEMQPVFIGSSEGEEWIVDINLCSELILSEDGGQRTTKPSSESSPYGR